MQVSDAIRVFLNVNSKTAKKQVQVYHRSIRLDFTKDSMWIAKTVNCKTTKFVCMLSTGKMIELKYVM